MIKRIVTMVALTLGPLALHVPAAHADWACVGVGLPSIGVCVGDPMPSHLP